MIKYRAEWICIPKIDRVEVIKETPKQVVLERRRETNSSEHHFYGETYKDACNWLLDKCLKIKADARNAIKLEKDNIAQADELFDKISKFKEE